MITYLGVGLICRQLIEILVSQVQSAKSGNSVAAKGAADTGLSLSGIQQLLESSVPSCTQLDIAVACCIAASKLSVSAFPVPANARAVP